MRNYAVLHIVADESRIFKTKERAPTLLTLEVFRPIELTLCKKPILPDVSVLYEHEHQMDDHFLSVGMDKAKQTRTTSRSFNITLTDTEMR